MSLKNRQSSSSRRVPFVWIVYARSFPGGSSPRERVGPLEELDAHERGFAALPCDRDRVARLGIDDLAEVRLEHVLLHPKRRARIEVFLLQEEAVRAVEVAHCAGGLGQDVETGHLKDTLARPGKLGVKPTRHAADTHAATRPRVAGRRVDLPSAIWSPRRERASGEPTVRTVWFDGRMVRHANPCTVVT